MILTMKKIKLTILAIFLGLASFAQEGGDEIQTLFGDDLSLGGFGGPVLKVTPVNGDLGLMIGGGGGLLINHQIVIGGAGYGLVTPSKFQGEDYRRGIDTTLSLTTGYGGLYLEYILMSDKPVHVSIPVLIGGGDATVKSLEKDYTTDFWNDYDSRLIEESSFFVIEPGLNLELNMLKFFRMDFGVSYRFVTGSDMINVSDNDLTNLSFNLGFRFGYF
jgi:hypothetical protein